MTISLVSVWTPPSEFQYTQQYCCVYATRTHILVKRQDFFFIILVSQEQMLIRKSIKKTENCAVTEAGRPAVLCDFHNTTHNSEPFDTAHDKCCCNDSAHRLQGSISQVGRL